MKMLENNEKYIKVLSTLLKNILRLVNLETEDGSIINIRSNMLCLRKKQPYYYVNRKIPYSDYHAIRFTEPRILMIKRQLESIFTVLAIRNRKRELTEVKVECSPFDLDMNISYTYRLGKEKRDEPQDLDCRGEIAYCYGDTEG